MLADHDIGIAEANDRCAQAVVDAALAVGVREVVISPGARNTPLVVAFHRCTTIKKTVIRPSTVRFHCS